MKQVILVFLLYFFCLTGYTQSVGIGTTSPNPNAILELNSINKGLLLPRMTTAQRNAISGAAGMIVYDNDFREFYHHDGVSWKKLLNSSFWNSSSTRNYIYNITDSIGVGTTTPDEKLHVYNGKIYMQDNRANENPHLIFDIPAIDYKEGGLQFTRASDTLASINYRNIPNIANYLRLSVSTNGTAPDLVINSDGHTGLGLTTPAVKFHIYDRLATEVMRIEAEAPLIQLRRRTSGVNTFPITFEDVGFLQTSGDNLRIGTNSGNTSGKFVIRTGGADRMQVDEAGNVSIATTAFANGYKLSVGGKVMCEELKVQLEGFWPDYVFEGNYKLRSIKDLEQYINTNKHLPNIPSAKEVAEEGISVGEMQTKMMEKIEELTLYIIQLKKEIDSLKKSK